MRADKHRFVQTMNFHPTNRINENRAYLSFLCHYLKNGIFPCGFHESLRKCKPKPTIINLCRLAEFAPLFYKNAWSVMISMCHKWGVTDELSILCCVKFIKCVTDLQKEQSCLIRKRL